MYILGVDAAWSVNNPSGVALIKCDKKSRPELIRAGRSYGEFIAGEINWQHKANGGLPEFKNIFQCCPSVDIATLDIPLAPFEIVGRREVDQALSKTYGKFKAATHSPVKGRPGGWKFSLSRVVAKKGIKQIIPKINCWMNKAAHS